MADDLVSDLPVNPQPPQENPSQDQAQGFTPEVITPVEQTPNAVRVWQPTGTPGSPSTDQYQANTQTYNVAPPLDKMTQARDDGYDWPEIDDKLASFRAEAGRFGYSDSQIDDHLGYQDQSAAFDRAAARWTQEIATDPTLTEDITHPSKPLGSGGQNASLMTGNTMDDYARALLNGEVKGPDDFAALMAKTFYHAMDTMQPGGTFDTKREEILANLTNAQQILKAQLPTPQELVDTSLAVADTSNLDASFGMVSNIQHNLMNHWTDTGERPMTALQRAMQDPALQAKLTGQPYKDPETIWGPIGRMFSAAKQAEIDNWSSGANPVEIANGVAKLMDQAYRYMGDPISGSLAATWVATLGLMVGGFATLGKMMGAVALPTVSVAAQLMSEVGLSKTGVNAPEESAVQAGEYVNMLGAIGAELGFARAGAQFKQARAQVGVLARADDIADTLRANASTLMDGSFPKGMTPPQMYTFDDATPFKPAAPEDIAPQPPITYKITSEVTGRTSKIGSTAGQAPTTMPTVEAIDHHRITLTDTDGNTTGFLMDVDGPNAKIVNLPKMRINDLLEVAHHVFSGNPDIQSLEGRARQGSVTLDRETVMQKPAASLEAMGATPHEVVQRSVQDALGRPMTPQAFDAAVQGIKSAAGDTFQRILEKAGAGPQSVALAKAYDVAAGIQGLFRSVMSDESGTLRIANPAAKRQTMYQGIDDLLSRLGSNPARDAAETLFNEKFGLSDQLANMYANKMRAYMGTVDKYVDDYGKAIRQGPASQSLMTDPLHIINRFIEGRSPLLLNPSHELYPIALALKDIHDDMWTQLTQRLGKDGAAQWFDSHYRYQFQRPALVTRAFQGRKGAPTLSEGIEQGLMPRNVNPIMARVEEINQIARYNAAYDVVDTAQKIVMPDGSLLVQKLGKNEIPQTGFIPLAGKPGLWAPKGFANTYNRFFNRGYASDAAGSSIYSKFMHLSNALTGLKLALPTYHAQAIFAESAMAQIAIGLGKIAQGEFLSGMGRLASGFTVVTSPFILARDGYRLQKSYLEQNMAGDPLATLFAQARGRPAIRQEVYKEARGPTYLEELQQFPGNLGNKVWGWAGNRLAGARNILPDPGLNPAAWTAQMAVRSIGFGFGETAKMFSFMTGSDFLFGKAIPWIKMGAFGDEMQMFLDGNPLASQADKLAHANRLVSSMDNRFGELNQDRLFWRATTKKVLNMALISLGWEYGSLRAFANAGGLNIDRLKPRLEMNPVAIRWLLAFGVGSAVLNNVYQYAKTGQPSWQTSSPILDSFLPRNGGTVTNSHITAPDRTLLPGYLKDVFNAGKVFLTNPVTSNLAGPAQNLWSLGEGKLNPFWQIAKMLVTGEDAIGHVIRDIPVNGHPPKTFGEMANNYLTTIWKEAEPIPGVTVGERKKGTGVSEVESILGYRPGPSWMVNPKGYEKGQQNREKFLQREELGRAKSEQSQLLEPTETFPASPGRQKVLGGTAYEKILGGKRRGSVLKNE